MLYRSPIRLSWIFMLLYYKLHSMFCGMGNKKSKRVTKIFSWVLSSDGNTFREIRVLITEEKKCSSGERKRGGRNSVMQPWVCRSVYLPGGQQQCILPSSSSFSFSISSTEDRLLWAFSWVISHMCSHMSIQFRNCIYLWIAYLELYGFPLFHSLWVSPRTWALQ